MAEPATALGLVVLVEVDVEASVFLRNAEVVDSDEAGTELRFLDGASTRDSELRLLIAVTLRRRVVHHASVGSFFNTRSSAACRSTDDARPVLLHGEALTIPKEFPLESGLRRSVRHHAS